MIASISWLDLAAIACGLLVPLALWLGAARFLRAWPIRLWFSMNFASLLVVIFALVWPNVILAHSFEFLIVFVTLQIVVGIALFVFFGRALRRIAASIQSRRAVVIDRSLGLLSGVAVGFLAWVVVAVVPALQFDNFMLNSYYLGGARGDKPTNAPDWIEHAVSRDAIVSTGQAIHTFCVSIYEQYVPALTNPPPAAGEQQGLLDVPAATAAISSLGLEKPSAYHISVMWLEPPNRFL